MFKIYFTLLIGTLLLGSCISAGTTKTSADDSKHLIKEYELFVVDSINCSVFEVTEGYVRVFSFDVLDSLGIVAVIDSISHLIPAKANVYFHISPIKDRGTEYATKIGDSFIVFADNVIRDQSDLNVFNIDTHLAYINSIAHKSENISPVTSVILDDLKDIDKNLNELKETPFAKKPDFKKLKSRITQAKRIYYPLMRKAFYEEAKNKMWEADIDVVMHGSHIYFYGYEYSRNKNIKESFEKIETAVERLRFSKVSFGIYKGGNYSTYTTYNGKDTD